jgi:glyoxylase I family protein
MLLGFEHVGTTTIDLDRAIDFYCGLLGLTVALRKHYDRGEVAFLDTGSGMLEVACPIADIARSRDVPPHEAGLRHLTFAFDSIDPVVARLEGAGFPMIEGPRTAYYNEVIKRLAFTRDPDGILVELVERADGR